MFCKWHLSMNLSCQASARDQILVPVTCPNMLLMNCAVMRLCDCETIKKYVIAQFSKLCEPHSFANLLNHATIMRLCSLHNYAILNFTIMQFMQLCNETMQLCNFCDYANYATMQCVQLAIHAIYEIARARQLCSISFLLVFLLISVCAQSYLCLMQAQLYIMI